MNLVGALAIEVRDVVFRPGTDLFDNYSTAELRSELLRQTGRGVLEPSAIARSINCLGIVGAKEFIEQLVVAEVGRRTRAELLEAPNTKAFLARVREFDGGFDEVFSKFLEEDSQSN